MILALMDSVTGSCVIENYPDFNEKLYSLSGKQFGTLYGDVTGEELFREYEDHAIQISTDEIKWKHWRIKVIKVKNKVSGGYEYSLNIRGCPAHAVFNGKNYETISLFDFKTEIESLASFLGIKANQIMLKPSEVSLTIHPGSEFNIQGRFIKHQGNKFTDFYKDKSDEFMGVIAKNAHYETWVYFVNVKYPELDKVAVRIERKYNRLVTYKRCTGIESFADIIELAGAKQNYKLIEQSVDDFIIFDPTLVANRRLYSKRINECIKNGGDPDFWKGKQKKLDSKTYWKLINDYRQVSHSHGEGLYHQIKEILEKHKAEILNGETHIITSWITGNNVDIDKKEGDDIIGIDKQHSNTQIETYKLINNMDNTQSALFSELHNLNQQYRSILNWVINTENTKREWIDELTRLNKGAAEGVILPADRWIRLDIQLELGNMSKADKYRYKEELANKIKGITATLFEQYQKIRAEFDTGKITLDEYIIHLESYRRMVESNYYTGGISSSTCKQIKEAVKEYLTSKAAA